MHLKKFLKYTEKLIVIVLRLYFPLFKKIFSLLQIHHSFYLLLSALGLQCCAQAFSGCSERALLFVAVLGCLTVVSSLVEHRLQALRLHWLQHTSSVVMAHRLSCFATCGIFLDQQSNLCSLHWEANSVLPGKSTLFFFSQLSLSASFFFSFFFVIYIWLCWVLVASCGIFIVAHRLSSCGSWAQLLLGVWDLSFPIRDQTRVPCIARWIPNQQTITEIPDISLLDRIFKINTWLQVSHPSNSGSCISFMSIFAGDGNAGWASGTYVSATEGQRPRSRRNSQQWFFLEYKFHTISLSSSVFRFLTCFLHQALVQYLTHTKCASVTLVRKENRKNIFIKC